MNKIGRVKILKCLLNFWTPTSHNILINCKTPAFNPALCLWFFNINWNYRKQIQISRLCRCYILCKKRKRARCIWFGITHQIHICRLGFSDGLLSKTTAVDANELEKRSGDYVSRPSAAGVKAWFQQVSNLTCCRMNGFCSAKPRTAAEEPTWTVFTACVWRPVCCWPCRLPRIRPRGLLFPALCRRACDDHRVTTSLSSSVLFGFGF